MMDPEIRCIMAVVLSNQAVIMCSEMNEMNIAATLLAFDSDAAKRFKKCADKLRESVERTNELINEMMGDELDGIEG